MTKKTTQTLPTPVFDTHDVVCWNCGKKAMIPMPNAKLGWVKCGLCGATDVLTTKGGP